MNFTYFTNEPNCSVDEDLFEFFVCQQQQQELYQRQAKQRLSQFKERSKKMLKKHDWERFFPASAAQPVETRKASAFERHLLCAENEPIVTEDESSFVSTIEYSFLMMENDKKVEASKPVVFKMSPFKAFKRNTDKMETPVISRKTNRIFNAEYNNSNEQQLELTKKQKLVHHQSLTFIADMASTSTPTRRTKQPITSTPKNTSHNPRKYLNTKTIRNKRKELKQPKQSTIKLDSNNFIIKQIQRGNKKVISILSNCSNCQQCSSQNFITATSYNFNNVDHSTPSSQRRSDFKKPRSTSTRNQIKKIRVEDVRKVLKYKRDLSNNKCANMVKPAKKQKVEISLEDLLYTPSKLARSDSFGAKIVQSSTRISSRTSTKPTDKVYFL